ncbi:MAG TPA: hypothetical protein PLF59_08095 [Cyclobacteriaceae bacterium]|nr:hypothetical protein [Cyclobacteriaceae bacterium]
MKIELIQIANDGFMIKKTNYWESKYAQKGLFYLSWNAGSARLLIPKIHEYIIKEILTARYVNISFIKLQEFENRRFFDLFFEDNSTQPFCIQISQEMSDRIIQKSDQGKCYFHAFTEKGLQVTMKAFLYYK